jgi:hypothetical protein
MNRALALMEKIMSKTTMQDRELQDSELASVSGGESYGPVVQGMIDLINQQPPPASGGSWGGGCCGPAPKNLRAA